MTTTTTASMPQQLQTATIHTFTIIRTPPNGFAGAPYCVAIIDTGDGLETVRIAGYIDGVDISVGDTVTALNEPDTDGATYSF